MTTRPNPTGKGLTPLSPETSGKAEDCRFSPEIRAGLSRLFRWRRDVRRFRRDPVPEAQIARLLTEAGTAPSVGLSEPWRFVRVESENAKLLAQANFERANAEALSGYSGEKAKIYAGLKLSGMQDVPVQFAVYCDAASEKGADLGVVTMPEMRAYSVVCAVMQLWLSARAEGLGLGWVSILHPAQLTDDLDLPSDWQLIAYLCLGHPVEEHTDPELERAGWERRAAPEILIR
ncbi:MAG: 5,6-dimethylbenzimidazole synthase [Pseudomonadota bacterium]